MKTRTMAGQHSGDGSCCVNAAMRVREQNTEEPSPCVEKVAEGNEEKREERREKSEENKKKKPLMRLFLFGVPGRIRTSDLQSRSR